MITSDIVAFKGIYTNPNRSVVYAATLGASVPVEAIDKIGDFCTENYDWLFHTDYESDVYQSHTPKKKLNFIQNSYLSLKFFILLMQSGAYKLGLEHEPRLSEDKKLQIYLISILTVYAKRKGTYYKKENN